MATVYDVAREANVSIATVSRVFNDNASVSAATREKVQRAAAKLNYMPHAGARNLMTRRTDTIGVILPDLHGQFFSEFVKGLDIAARGRDQHLLLSGSHDDAQEMAAALAAMRGRVDGVVVMSPLISTKALRTQVPQDMPIVIVNGDGEKAFCPTVSIDNFAGAVKMTEHLLEQGCRRIALISGPADNHDAQQRKCGYADAMTRHGAQDDVDIVVGDFFEESGYAAGLDLLSRKSLPDAVFASNDAMAIGCLSALDDHGVAVPDDIAVAGFDDIPLARYVRPSLSTVGVPIAELGRKSFELIRAELETERADGYVAAVVLSPELVIRNSTRKARAAANAYGRDRDDT